MAEEKHAEAGGDSPAPSKPKKKLDPQALLVIVNTLAILGALGFAVYTKLLFKKPAIVEETELNKIKEEVKKPDAGPAEKSLIPFESMTLNLAVTAGKAHYATISFSVEARDAESASAVKQLKAQFVDKFIALLGKKEFTELNTIQGKLILKTELTREFNAILKESAKITVGVTDVFFSDFILQ